MDLENSIYTRVAVPPQPAADNTALSSLVIDTGDVKAQGAKSLWFLCAAGDLQAALAQLKVNASDTQTNATTLGGTVTELLDVAANHTLPSASDDNLTALIKLDLRGRHPRYVQLAPVAGDGASGSFFSAIAVFTNVVVPDDTLGGSVFATDSQLESAA